MRGNRHLIELGSDPDQIAQLLARLKAGTWSLPIAVLSGDLCIGMATTALADTKGMHVSLLSMFVDPPAASRALALYLRHVFWTFPVRRIHVQVPDLDLVREYVALYESVGFVNEGRLVNHLIVAGQSFDVITLGLLRADFESWAQAQEPDLGLA